MLNGKCGQELRQKGLNLVVRFISSVTYFFGLCRSRIQLAQELHKVLASEVPFERFGNGFVVALEFQQSLGYGGKVRKIVGRKYADWGKRPPGLPAEEARRAAQLRLGSITRLRPGITIGQARQTSASFSNGSTRLNCLPREHCCSLSHRTVWNRCCRPFRPQAFLL
jgi:hypothetical protein